MDLGDVGLFDGSTPIPQALEQLRLRLLDLTGRNRLLNFKHTAGRSLQLVPSNLNEIFSRLIAPGAPKLTIDSVPHPSRDDWVERSGRMAKPEAKEHAKKLGLSTDYEEASSRAGSRDSALALYYNEDLGKHCRKLEREARLAIEETGANMLYLVFGFLEYPDSRDAEITHAAPLVCLPARLELSQEGQRANFKISYSGEEIEQNLSLREKLKRDHSVFLPDIPDEEEGIEKYFQAIETVIRTLPRWRVRRSLSLALLSFANMLLVRDLDPENWIDEHGNSFLLSHPIIRQVFQGGDSSQATYHGEYQLDDMPDADFPLISDADSSQHSAIVDVLAGRSLVIEGPPGTGKSQTITNIIAACLNSGKKVLFVAEKLAALQVVQARLKKAGLDPFILELHSNKTSKRQVLDAIGDRLSTRIAAPRDIEQMEETLNEKRTGLKEHAKLLNSAIGNALGRTLHEILWRSDNARSRLGPLADIASKIDVEWAPSVNATEYKRQCDELRQLAALYSEVGAFDSSHPYWGFYPNELAPGDDLKIGNIFVAMHREALLLCELTDSVKEAYGFGELGKNAAEVHRSKLESLASSLATGALTEILAKIFGKGKANRDLALRELEKAEKLLSRIVQLEHATDGKIDRARAASAKLSIDDQAFIGKNALGTAPVSDLAIAIERLHKSTERSSEILAQLRSISDDVGLSYSPKLEAIQKLGAIARATSSVPVDSLHYRRQELQAAFAVEMLERGSKERARLLAQEDAIAQRFYVDQQPSEEALRGWVQTLRKGAAWYRIFQRDWRAAIAGHRDLSKNKVRVAPAQRLEELEELATFNKARTTWLSSPSLAKLVGVDYDFDTNVDKYLAVASWLKSARTTLDEAAVGAEEIDLVLVPAARLERLHRLSGLILELIQELSAEEVTLQKDCHEELSSDWELRLSTVRAYNSRLAALRDTFQSILQPELSVRDSSLLLDACEERGEAVEGDRRIPRS